VVTGGEISISPTLLDPAANISTRTIASWMSARSRPRRSSIYRRTSRAGGQSRRQDAGSWLQPDLDAVVVDSGCATDTLPYTQNMREGPTTPDRFRAETLKAVEVVEQAFGLTRRDVVTGDTAYKGGRDVVTGTDVAVEDEVRKLLTRLSA
jgi:hypothetical protein